MQSRPFPRCRIYVHTSRHTSLGNERSRESTNSMAYAESHATWRDHHYSTELWLNEALQRHPWRVTDPNEADLIYLAANLSRACYAGKSFSAMRMWKELVAEVWGNSLVYKAPKAISMQYMACRPWTGSQIPRDLLMTTEFVQKAKQLASTRPAPFVISRPLWLVGAASPPPSPPFAQRKLLLFSGHVPKLSVSPTRYHIWKQLRLQRHRATVQSHTINCTIGQFEVCRWPPEVLAQKSNDWFRTRCHSYCGGARASI